MHELSICRSMVDIVDRYADGRRVDVVRLQVGQLRQCVPDTLEYCWGLATQGTAYAGAVLEVDQVPAAVECRACSRRTVLEQPVLACSACSGTDVRIVAGEELLITSIDVRAPDRSTDDDRERESHGPLPSA